VDGASGSENSFIIDGQEVSNFRTGVLNANNNLPFQFVQEVQIKTSGFEAEFGGATGGVINVVTKGGSNEIHGLAQYEFEPDKLWSGPRAVLNSFRTGTGANFLQINEYLRPKKDDFFNQYPSFAVGGPIAKDRLWFFTSYAPQIFRTTRTTQYFSADPRTRTQTAQQTYQLRQRNEYTQGRIDAAPFNTLRVSASYIWNPISQDGNLPDGQISLGGVIPSVNFGGNIGTLTGRQLTDRQGGRLNSNNVTTQAVWTPKSTLVASFRFSRGFLNEKLGSYFIPQQTRFLCGGPTVNTTAGAGCTQGFSSFPTNNNIFFDASIRRNFEGDISYILNKLGGRHEFKGGYQNTKVSNNVLTGYIPYGIVQLFYGLTINDLTGRNDAVTAGTIGAGQLTRFGRTGNASNTANSIYVQDRWQPTSRLSLNLGVRFEKEDLPSFNSFAPPINFGWGDKIVPRLGFAYDLTGHGKTKLFASYSRFTDRLKFELPRGSFGGEFFRRDYFEISAANPRYDYYTLARVLGNNVDVLNGKCPINNPSGLTRCQYDFRVASNNPNATIEDGKVDPNLKPFQQEEFTVGFERELSSSYLLSVRYSYKNLLNAIEDAGFPNSQGSEAYIIGNPGSGLHAATAAANGYSKTTKPQRRYDALEIKLDRRFSRNYFFNLAYTYSRLYGNYSGLASSDENGRTSPGVNRFFDLPHLGFTAAGVPDNGRLATDRPHVFNVYGAYNFNWLEKVKNNSTQFSLFSTIQSGTPQTSFYSFYAAAVQVGRGNLGRTPVFTNTDFAVSHRVKITERYNLAFDFNVLNVFNEANTMGLVTNQFGVNPSLATLGLPANINDEPKALNYVLTTGITSQLDAYLNNAANPQRRNTAVGLANSFQGVRQVRLGLRFTF
jgi:outer membrane receptor protein involved in Fe transport